SEGLVAAAALLAGGEGPGVWVVLTGYTPEGSPADPDSPGPEAPAGLAPFCLGGALALTAPRPGGGPRRLGGGRAGGRGGGGGAVKVGDGPCSSSTPWPTP